MRIQSAEALGTIGSAEAIQPLIEFSRKAYADYNFATGRYWDISHQAYIAGAKALTEIRGEHTVNKLISLLAGQGAYREACARKMII